MPARLAAKNLQIDALPLIVTPHPLNDLTADAVRELARAVYPLIIRQLTDGESLEQNVYAEFVHPANRKTPNKMPAGSKTGREV